MEYSAYQNYSFVNVKKEGIENIAGIG